MCDMDKWDNTKEAYFILKHLLINCSFVDNIGFKKTMINLPIK